MFDEQVTRSVGEMAGRIGVAPAALLAVADVESGGTAFAKVSGRDEPLIRFEGHYFDRRLSGGKRRRARAAGLSSPIAGVVKNPKSQADRWRLLERAAAIDRQAAYESVSWGMGQVMGAHWQWLGYGSIGELVADARAGAHGQISLMVRYIDKAGLLDALRRQDWKVFARGYNGPAYARNGYDTRLETAYRRHMSRRPPSLVTSNPGGESDPHDAARMLQRLLAAAGYSVVVDGIVGRETRRSIRRFQADYGLDVDGIAGPETMEALRRAVLSDDWGLWSPSYAV